MRAAGLILLAAVARMTLRQLNEHVDPIPPGVHDGHVRAMQGGVAHRTHIVLRHDPAARVDSAQHVDHLTEHSVPDGREVVASTNPTASATVDVVASLVIQL
jgi:hypothetical protein